MNIKSPQVVTMGQAVVDCIVTDVNQSAIGKSHTASGIRLKTGGDAVNEAFALAKMGIHTQMVCAVGCDAAGNMLLEEANKRSVGTDYVHQSESLQTVVAVIMSHTNGTRESISSQAALLDGYQLEVPNIESAKIVTFASLFRAPFDQPEQVIYQIKRAHELGYLICADTKMPTFRKMTLEDIKEVLPYIDYFFPNETEASYYSGEKEYEKMAEVFLNYGIKHVVIKAGADGIYAFDGIEQKHMEAVPVNVVDTTGAGDNFVAGFIKSLLEQKSFWDSCQTGLIAAAECISSVGG